MPTAEMAADRILDVFMRSSTLTQAARRGRRLHPGGSVGTDRPGIGGYPPLRGTGHPMTLLSFPVRLRIDPDDFDAVADWSAPSWPTPRPNRRAYDFSVDPHDRLDPGVRGAGPRRRTNAARRHLATFYARDGHPPSVWRASNSSDGGGPRATLSVLTRAIPAVPAPIADVGSAAGAHRPRTQSGGRRRPPRSPDRGSGPTSRS